MYTRRRKSTYPRTIGILPFQLFAKFPASMTTRPAPVQLIGTLTVPSSSGLGLRLGLGTDGPVAPLAVGALVPGMAMGAAAL